MEPIDFTLWVFEVCGITDVKRLELANMLSNVYLMPLVDGRIRSARARVVTGSDTITPGKFDSVVFLTNIGFQGAGSIMRRLGDSPVEAIGNDRVSGLFSHSTGVAEAYWSRCELLPHVCAAIFHEAGHQKYKGKASMHDEPGVLVLASHTRNAAIPNSRDIEVFEKAIPHIVTLQTRVPPIT